MDFTLALTHFCEAHGPKSVLCTQVLPLECALCLPPSPSLRASSSESLSTQIHESSCGPTQNSYTRPPLRKTDTNVTLPTDFSGASTTVDSEYEPDHQRPTIEKHPLFQTVDHKRELGSQWRYGRAQGDACASCSFSIPKAVAEKLPAGAPGSKNTADGKSPSTNTGAPVLRSREFVCMRDRRPSSGNDTIRGSKASSYGSSVASSCSRDSSQSPVSPSNGHPDNCHDHTLTYLTAKSPGDPESYAKLRASVIRTLSCELLPRGMSDGPLCFGDSNTGYTIAYVFRLTDPKARGRRRAYAFIALAGKDASRAFQACPLLWEAFANMAKGIESAAQRHQERQRQKEEQEAAAKSANATRSSFSNKYTPVSSFLTARTVDPDGHPRRVGHAAPRSLAEIVGDENIFTYLHQYFVAILRALGDQFGGLPLAEQPSVYQSVGEESPPFARASMVGHSHSHSHSHSGAKLGGPTVKHMESLRDEDLTPTVPQQSHSQPQPSSTTSAAPTTDQNQATTTGTSSCSQPTGSGSVRLENKDKDKDVRTGNDTDSSARDRNNEKAKEKDKDKDHQQQQQQPKDDPLEVAKMRANKTFKLNPLCAPMAVNETAQRQVVV
ncbi:hypothetical protein HRR83_007435 [Exophiala dermatitidis]|uniref:UDENN FLCN/SMCR8-type domain-containing protein n=2 Tax=Exophiala dermatitidis TaxID=5970 RepID=H6C278_EXODN|nr:uncharacterized protein HMPREF1120_06714 [Exophiala dermatitidis NIH/UT8656]KAJ4508493.1 hypothetical protein HRR75_006314 [Exophiala dermatitidis]EHY58710.1 hypothetical protein HMPREF1120_06714 [Exophiala dermatitidis NIH/UT8656]KAJ4510409.1 hypothetical protein HRR74_006881 [Exophiala dermatitidis]KAJ4510657.1 hypothetical protein HRR73_006729 [Exophiala dermatitidis]KAJ4535017.1 hypothetical protein HRR76_006919 [Exophiala dermatitidis]